MSDYDRRTLWICMASVIISVVAMIVSVAK
jgi:hypothetical protein